MQHVASEGRDHGRCMQHVASEGRDHCRGMQHVASEGRNRTQGKAKIQASSLYSSHCNSAEQGLGPESVLLGLNSARETCSSHAKLQAPRT